MAILDRTNYTALVDDDGTNTTGTVWDKSHISSVTLDPIDTVVNALYAVCQGRLTLTTGVPVTTSDVTAATTLRFTPYLGARIALYDGSQWKMVSFAEVTGTVPSTTSTMYDVFGPYSSGSLGTLEFVAWTNDTTRATALTTQDGIYVKTGDATRRYLGSIRTTTVSGQTEDSFAKRYVWNYYNRVERPMRANEATDSWTYSTATFRQANAATTNQLDFVIGVSEVPVTALLLTLASNSTGGVSIRTGMGLDSTTTVSADCNPGQLTALSAGANSFIATYRGYPGVGRHTLVWLEYSVATGTTTWFGDAGVPPQIQAGLSGSFYG